jgi:hypothetical protein
MLNSREKNEFQISQAPGSGRPGMSRKMTVRARTDDRGEYPLMNAVEIAPLSGKIGKKRHIPFADRPVDARARGISDAPKRE